ncbi:hypothetical protein A2Z33_00035 [Candidatus Gottesmanbacteria bacterium RBG_16_52_11]|uniref:Uncharacterized protein n=1 Tax=Candidatus Gottesmanbacteria bacterium RBG_16_52_11 TaxID=1798374 RepID=A0A1F5YMZ2_9BACT|nr:MAG: hypothetical protein A2Z33_00035 [Candidatus Gottesmanbacteria bacterium RBG_16_52_11]
MAQNNPQARKGRGRRPQQGRQNNTAQLGAAKAFMWACLRDDSGTLKDMTEISSEGAIGAQASNRSALTKTGASHVGFASRKGPYIDVDLTNAGGMIVAIARLLPVGRKFSSDWKVYQLMS